MRIQFLTDLPLWLCFLGLACAAGIGAWLSARELRELEGVHKWTRWLLPSLRGLAILLVAFSLLEPTLSHRTRVGSPGRLFFIVDDSRSMMLRDDLRDLKTTDIRSGSPTAAEPVQKESIDPDNPSRYRRAMQILSHSERGLLGKLEDRFELVVGVSNEWSGFTPVWESKSSLLPRNGQAAAWAALSDQELTLPSESTQLGSMISSVADAISSKGMSDAQSIVVLLSDGQHNSGPPPIDAATTLREQGTAMFAVGVGPSETTQDISVHSGSVVRQAFRSGRVTGSFQVTESIPAESQYRASIHCADRELWTQSLQAIPTERLVEFDFPAESLHDALKDQWPAGIQVTAATAQLEIRVTSQLDRILENNRHTVFTKLALQADQVLVVDGRSRWETRYLKNLFERDPAWSVKACIAKPNLAPSLGEPISGLPVSQSDLFAYSLVVLGEVNEQHLGKEFVEYLSAFVEKRGGGLICIDGSRQVLQASGSRTLRDLFPVRWTEAVSRFPSHVELTEAGKVLQALRLADSEGEDSAVAAANDRSSDRSPYADLPELEFVSAVQPKPGAETLALAHSRIETTPFLVSKSFGAGRVVYVASDETWRWRYRDADRLHGRFWNQIARWVMAQPFGLNSDYLSLDTGDAAYPLGAPVPVRCRLRNAKGEPEAKARTSLVLINSDGALRKIPLVPNTNVPGLYSASVTDLPVGDYEATVEAEGYAHDTLKLTSRFRIESGSDVELRHSHCNESLLKRLTNEAGGTYVHESDLLDLVKQLRPLSGGEFVTISQPIWPTFGWFLAAMGCLASEWWLRKKVGLM
jgi:hypothetical protein